MKAYFICLILVFQFILVSVQPNHGPGASTFENRIGIIIGNHIRTILDLRECNYK
jgi:hypothetical protein